jgi:hypothetical protein
VNVAKRSSEHTFKFTGKDESVGLTLNSIDRKMGSFGSNAAKWAKRIAGVFAVAFAADKLVSWGSTLFSLGQDIQVWGVKVDTVFGSSAGSIRAWADDVNESFGESDERVAGLAAAMGDLLVPLGATRSEAADLSQTLVGAAPALAAWSGGQYDAAAVSEILQKALLGERDSLKALGISINQAEVDQRALNIAKEDGRTAVTELDKAVATSQLILEKSTDAQEAWNNGSLDSIKNTNELKARWADLRGELAEKFLPVANAVVAWAVDSLIPALERINWEPFVTGLQNVATWIQDHAIPAIADMYSWLSGNLIGAFNAVSDWWDEHGPGIIEAFNSVRDAAVEFGSGVASTWEDDISPALSSLGTAISDLWSLTTAAFANMGGSIDALGINWSLLGEAVGTAIALMLDRIANMVTGIGAMAQVGGSYLSDIRRSFEQLSSAIEYAQTVFQKLKDLAERGINFPSLSLPSISLPGRVRPRAAGGYITTPEFAVIGEGRFNEFVFNAEQMRGLAAEGIQLAGRGQQAGTTIVNNTYVTVEGSVLSENQLADTVARLNRDQRVAA